MINEYEDKLNSMNKEELIILVSKMIRNSKCPCENEDKLNKLCSYYDCCTTHKFKVIMNDLMFHEMRG